MTDLTIDKLLAAIRKWCEAERDLTALPDTAYLRDIDQLSAALKRKNDAGLALHEINVEALASEYSETAQGGSLHTTKE